jgi:MerR family transcriptional regulator, thiopeptide resistance regulator
MKLKPIVYRIQEFASIAGVTVRALHHYDRLGLLKPSARSNGGYRLYRDSDLIRLEQIVVLKFVGLSLKQIGRLLRRESSLSDTLRTQQRVLSEKRQRLGWAIDAIAEAERSLNGGEPDWNLFKRIVKEIEMQNDTEWSRKYYSPEAQKKVDERKKLWSPELQAEVTLRWSELFTDIEKAIADGERPSGILARDLAARWRTLVEGFTGGDPEIQKGLNKMWNDRANWPSHQRESYAVKPELQDFIMKAMHAGSVAG